MGEASMNVGSELEPTTLLLANRGLTRRRYPSVMDPGATLAGQPAGWVLVVRRRLEALAQLEEGWDGRKAKRVSRENIETAIQLLQGVMRKDTPLPELVPTVRGGLQIEWHVPDVDVEMEILSPSRYALWFEDRTGDLPAIDSELNADLAPFRKAVERLRAGL
jgi:hypothetical protein